MPERGHAIPLVGLWWLRLARSLVANDKRDLSTLGKDLARHVHRRAAFHKGTLSRFVKGTHPVTYELIRSLCAEYTRLPPPPLFPESYEEAVQMQMVRERYSKMVLDGNENPAPSVTPLRDEDGRRRGKRVAATADHTPKRRNAG